MTALALVGNLFGRQQDELWRREDESRRIAHDPIALADLSTQSMRRVDPLIIAELEDAKRHAREETEQYCLEIDRIIQAVQEHSAPIVERLTAHTEYLASVRESLAKARGG
jgi:hypothetical protein